MLRQIPLWPLVPLVAATSSQAAVFSVDASADAVDAAPGDGVRAAASSLCTLCAAVMEANALAGADTIQLPAGTALLVAGVRWARGRKRRR
jgi:hypothetical protein